MPEQDDPMGFNEDELREFLSDEAKNKIAAIGAEFDQFRAAVVEVAQTVCAYRQELRKSKSFTREEQFMLTMDYQTAVLHAILNGNFGDRGQE